MPEKGSQRSDVLPIDIRKYVKRLNKEGEPCGACMCPPTYSAGECERHLECVGNGGIDDAPGRCMVPGQYNTIEIISSKNFRGKFSYLNPTKSKKELFFLKDVSVMS